MKKGLTDRLTNIIFIEQMIMTKKNCHKKIYLKQQPRNLFFFNTVGNEKMGEWKKRIKDYNRY